MTTGSGAPASSFTLVGGERARLVLGSSSPYRRALLERLRLPFDVLSPAADERPRPGETGRETVVRLALAKRDATCGQLAPPAVGDDASAPPAPARIIVITSDQVALIDDRVLGKPGDRAANIAQLRAAAGRTVTLLTSACVTLLVPEAAPAAVSAGRWRRAAAPVDVERFDIAFRPLDAKAIERYVDREQAFDCAGGFRAEGLGVTLFETMQGRDPSAVVGLPLIAVCARLRALGVRLP